MHLLGGMKWSHYSRDNGSFTLFGKGQPLVLDWGYKGIKPAWWHSKINLKGMGYFKEFSAQADTDYVRFEYDRQTLWQRQVLFVKDPDPLGSNYYLVRDIVSPKKPTSVKADDWFLWLNTVKVPMVKDNVIIANCKGDVNLDVWMPKSLMDRIKRIERDEAEFINNPNALPNADADIKIDDVDDDLDLEEDSVKVLSPFLESRSHSFSKTQGRLREGTAPIAYRYFNSGDGLFQRSIRVSVKRQSPILAVLYPRMKTDKPAVFTDLDGKGVMVKSGNRVDYVFLSHKPIVYKKDTISFSGRAGAVIIKENAITLSLSAAGKISYKHHVLESKTATQKTFKASNNK